MRVLLQMSVVVALTVWLPVNIAASDSEPPAPAPVAEAKQLDAATMAALGIEDSSRGVAATTARSVAPEAGAWSWTSGAYSYDPSGNITAIGTQSFLYDVQGRLVDATVTRPGSSEHRGYSYDSYGNRTAMEVGSSQITTPTSTSTNHLTSLSAAYDAAGNVTQLQPPGQTVLYQYKYDALGALQEVKAANVANTPTEVYIYTADEERLWSFDLAANASHWKIRDLNGKVLRDYYVPGTTWTLSRDYIYRDGQLLAAVTPSETLHFSLDHLGTPRVITGSTRARLGFHHYLPFGEEWTDETGAQEDEPMKFTGHERDVDVAGGSSGLDYMHARYYAASMGRFLSVDPIFDVKRALKQPQMWNRYAYALNNPLRFIDPTGMLTYQAAVLGVDVVVHIDDELDEKAQLALKAIIDAAFARINGGKDELTKQEQGIVTLIKSLEVGREDSGMNTQTGQFTMFAPHLMMQSSDAFAADYVHDSKHMFNAKPLNPLYTDWFVGGRRQNIQELDERDASEFAVRVGGRIGLEPDALWKYQRVLIDSVCNHQWWRDH